jgi:hypothetical protein
MEHKCPTLKAQRCPTFPNLLKSKRFSGGVAPRRGLHFARAINDLVASGKRNLPTELCCFLPGSFPPRVGDMVLRQRSRMARVS